jgi:hypothetical protein
MTTPYLIVTSDPGTYSVLFIQDVNCIGVPSGSAIVLVFPIPETPVIVQNNFELISSSCCGNQWYLDGSAIPGATGQTYMPSMVGTYFDIVTLNGCSSDTSNIIIVTVIAIDQKKSDPILFYPNPANEWVKFISPGQGCRDTKIQIMNSYGKLVKEFCPDKMAAGNERKLFVGDLAPGFYLVMIKETGKTYYFKLIIE